MKKQVSRPGAVSLSPLEGRAGLPFGTGLALLLAGVGLALVGWLAFGPRAQAQTTPDLDEAQCEAGGSYIPSFVTSPSAEFIADCKAVVQIRNHFTANDIHVGLNTDDGDPVFDFENWGTGPKTTIDTWHAFGPTDTGPEENGIHVSPDNNTGLITGIILRGSITLAGDGDLVGLTGLLPAAISNLTALETLIIGQNELTGPLPDISRLTSLERLEAGRGMTPAGLDGNQLTGRLPATLPASLTTLDLGGNQLTGQLPATLPASLTTLDLGGNQLTGTIPDLTPLDAIAILDLGGNQLTGPLPDLTALTSTRITSMVAGRAQGQLDFGGNQLTGSLGDLSSLEGVVILHLDNNLLTGSVPMLPPNLRTLYLHNNQLTGSVPMANAIPTSLQTLRLDGNQLTGDIPDLSSRSSLLYLSLALNQLTSTTLPSFNTGLVGLDLGGNQLTGMIPTAIGSFSDLRTLFLGSNQLTGAIPTQLGMLSMLEDLDLSNNDLTGTVPAALGLDGDLDREVEGGRCLPLSIQASLPDCNVPNVEVSPAQRSFIVTGTMGDSDRITGYRYTLSDADRTTGYLPGRADQVTIPGLEHNLEYTVLFQVLYDGGDYSSWTRFTETTLPAPPVAPGADGAGMASNPTDFSACAGMEGGGSFEDISDSFAEADIGCIAGFGITQGRTATMFAPGEVVSRWQMALFLARAAGPAGVELDNPALDQGFTDIGGLSAEAQQATNALAAAGIMPGITTQEFGPNVLVTRSSMAVLLDAFLSNAVIGSGGTDPADVRPDNNSFVDIEDVPVVDYDAILRIYELGITRGTTETTFSPDQLVTRAQMAAFIARTLAHTQARPAGITIQSQVDTDLAADGEVELLISVRTTDFRPVEDAIVDLFSYTADNADQAFDTNGGCVTSRVVSVGRGITVCQIDLDDFQADSSGDITITLDDDDVSDDQTVVAWTGDDGDDYNNDTTDAATLRLSARQPATQLIVSDNLADTQQLLQFGETFQLILQVADAEGNPLAIPEQGIRVSLDERASDGSLIRTTRSHFTDSDGRITLPFTHTDSDPNRSNTASVVLALETPAYTFNFDTSSTLDCETGDTCTAMWSDAAPEPTTLQLTQLSEYTIAGNGATNQVTATLTDQYGQPLAGEELSFFIGSVPLSMPNGLVRFTTRAGKHIFTYNRNASTSLMEEIVVRHTGPTNRVGRGELLPSANENDAGRQTLTHYWVTELADSAITDRMILLRDTTNNRILFQGEAVTNTDGDIVDPGFQFLAYDSNDQFYQGDALSLSTFEQNLADVDTISVANYSSDTDQVSRFSIPPRAIANGA